jgi:hypothetical protein
MPEGLENDLKPQDVADLLAYLRSARKSKTFAGNQPRRVAPAAGGSLRLVPADCEIYGPTLVLEKQYGNLGHWESEDDMAVWEVEVPRSGKYAVWLEWACPDTVAGNGFVLECGTERLTGKVAGTGTWDTYRKAKVGVLTLEAGARRLVMHSAGPIRRQGALLDLKSVTLVPQK